MEKKYISVDVESSGPTPGMYFMISLGACIVGDTDVQFYRELKPMNRNYIHEGLRIGCMGLECLEDLMDIDECNPRSEKFNPEPVIDIMQERGKDIKEAMNDFYHWVVNNTQGYRAVEVAAPIKYDGSFTSWYFDHFLKKNPFGHSGDDINSMYRGVMGNPDASIKDMGYGDLPHNALKDAVIQAHQMEEVLRLMKNLNQNIK